MVAAGFCINQRGGAYINGKARPLQDKAAVAKKYFDLEENLLAGQHISVQLLAKASSVNWGFANKVVGEIESGLLIDPSTKAQGRICGDGALALTDEDGFYLLHLQNLNNRFTLRDYAAHLAANRGTFVSRAVISKWFHTSFPFKGSMKKLNRIPIDKFTDNNILRWAEYVYRVQQVPPWCLVFGDEKPLKGLFN